MYATRAFVIYRQKVSRLLTLSAQGVAYTLEGRVRNPSVPTWPGSAQWRIETRKRSLDAMGVLEDSLRIES